MVFSSGSRALTARRESDWNAGTVHTSAARNQGSPAIMATRTWSLPANVKISIAFVCLILAPRSGWQFLLSRLIPYGFDTVFA